MLKGRALQPGATSPAKRSFRTEGGTRSHQTSRNQGTSPPLNQRAGKCERSSLRAIALARARNTKIGERGKPHRLSQLFDKYSMSDISKATRKVKREKHQTQNPYVVRRYTRSEITHQSHKRVKMSSLQNVFTFKCPSAYNRPL